MEDDGEAFHAWGTDGLAVSGNRSGPHGRRASVGESSKSSPIMEVFPVDGRGPGTGGGGGSSMHGMESFDLLVTDGMVDASGETHSSFTSFIAAAGKSTSNPATVVGRSVPAAADDAPLPLAPKRSRLSLGAQGDHKGNLQQRPPRPPPATQKRGRRPPGLAPPTAAADPSMAAMEPLMVPTSGIGAIPGLPSAREFAHGGKVNYEYAEWKKGDGPKNSQLFCELCVEEISLGNRLYGTMLARGYANICEKFFARTGKRHSKEQFKNRWDKFKALYNFWVSGRAHTGNSYDAEKDAILASAEWWEKNAKMLTSYDFLLLLHIVIILQPLTIIILLFQFQNNVEVKKLKYGPPACLDELEIMFKLTAIDGSTSCIPKDGEAN